MFVNVLLSILSMNRQPCKWSISCWMMRAAHPLACHTTCSPLGSIPAKEGTAWVRTCWTASFSTYLAFPCPWLFLFTRGNIRRECRQQPLSFLEKKSELCLLPSIQSGSQLWQVGCWVRYGAEMRWSSQVTCSRGTIIPTPAKNHTAKHPVLWQVMAYHSGLGKAGFYFSHSTMTDLIGAEVRVCVCVCVCVWQTDTRLCVCVWQKQTQGCKRVCVCV